MKDLLLFSKVFWLYILFTVHFLTLFRHRSAMLVFMERNGLQRQSSVPSRCRCNESDRLKKHVPCPSIPIFLCRPTVFCSTCWSRGTSEHSPYKPDLPLPLRIGTFPRFVAIGFYFLSETLIYQSLHQSFFYSFITILPSESGVTLHYSTILP